ncbi:hypothetical protein GQX74_001178 [Glossina fuscipes]|nr:hypothetical protein GQX74_001178 [Glossina fuscipes]
MAGVASKGSSMVNNLLAQLRPQMDVFWKYAKVELTPPSPGDIGAIRNGISKLIKGAQSGSYKNLTVREAWLNTLVTMEIILYCFNIKSSSE